jgi:FkbM family methyltransferase
MIITNILKGIGKRLSKKKSTHSGHQLGWLAEKLLKHKDDQFPKKYQFPNLVLNYIRPYEVIKTYKEIFTEEIYKFNNKSDYPVIIDCGANIGISTIYFAIAYPNARVYAFEPDNTLFEILHQNIQDNKLQHVALFNEAIWIQDTHISFSNKGSEASQIDTSGVSETKVKAINFANFLTQFDKIDFLKIDIEGAEYDVVKHCAEALNKTENLFLEYHGTNAETEKLTTLLDIVKDAGFKVYIKMAADNLNKPFVEKTTGTPFDVQLNIFCYK